MMPTRRQSSLPDPEAASPAVRYEMVSVSESKIAEIARSARADMIEHTTAQLTRPFPDGWRQDSSNMDPTVSWGVGSHMVCLNFQTWDLGIPGAVVWLRGGPKSMARPKAASARRRRGRQPKWRRRAAGSSHVRTRCAHTDDAAA